MLTLRVSFSRVDRLSASGPRRTRYPVMLSFSGSSQVRVMLSCSMSDVVSPVGAAGGWSLTRWVTASVQGPLDRCSERSAL